MAYKRVGIQLKRIRNVRCKIGLLHPLCTNCCEWGYCWLLQLNGYSGGLCEDVGAYFTTVVLLALFNDIASQHSSICWFQDSLTAKFSAHQIQLFWYAHPMIIEHRDVLSSGDESHRSNRYTLCMIDSSKLCMSI